MSLSVSIENCYTAIIVPSVSVDRNIENLLEKKKYRRAIVMVFTRFEKYGSDTATVFCVQKRMRYATDSSEKYVKNCFKKRNGDYARSTKSSDGGGGGRHTTDQMPTTPHHDRDSRSNFQTLAVLFYASVQFSNCYTHYTHS